MSFYYRFGVTGKRELGFYKVGLGFWGLKNFLYVCKLWVSLENNFRVMYEIKI